MRIQLECYLLPAFLQPGHICPRPQVDDTQLESWHFPLSSSGQRTLEISWLVWQVNLIRDVNQPFVLWPTHIHTSYLTFPHHISVQKPNIPLKSLEDLARSSTFLPMFMRGTVTHDLFQVSFLFLYFLQNLLPDFHRQKTPKEIFDTLIPQESRIRSSLNKEPQCTMSSTQRQRIIASTQEKQPTATISQDFDLTISPKHHKELSVICFL